MQESYSTVWNPHSQLLRQIKQRLFNKNASYSINTSGTGRHTPPPRNSAVVWRTWPTVKLTMLACAKNPPPSDVAALPATTTEPGARNVEAARLTPPPCHAVLPRTVAPPRISTALPAIADTPPPTSVATLSSMLMLPQDTRRDPTSPSPPPCPPS